MKCSKCGAEIAGGTQFCPGCGAEVNAQPQFVPAPPKVTCRECGEINDSRFEFCQNCGAALGDVDPTLMQSEPRKEKNIKPPKLKNGKISAEAKKDKPQTPKAVKNTGEKRVNVKKIAVAAAAVIAIAAIVVLAATLFGGKGSKADNVLFIQDKNIVIASLGGKEPQLRTLTDNFGLDDADKNAAQLSKDGKSVCFIDNAASGGCALYRLDISSGVESGLPVRVCSDIRSPDSYRMTDDGKKIFFIKSSGELCVCDLKTVKVLAESAEDFTADDNGSYVVFTARDDGELQLRKMNVKDSESEIIDRRVEGVSVQPGAKTVFYFKDGSLYRRDKGGEKERVAADVLPDDISNITENGCFYYVTSDEVKVNAAELVEDDRTNDAMMEMPEAPDFPRTADFRLSSGGTDWDAYHAAEAKHDELAEQYDKDMAEYEQMLARNALREELGTTEVSYFERALFYFDGSESIKVNDAGGGMISDVTDDGTVLYVRPGETALPKLMLSEIKSADDVQKALIKLLDADGKLYIARAGTESATGAKAEGHCFITGDGRAVWRGKSGIYTLKLEGENEAELACEGGSEWLELENGKLVFFKSADGAYEIYSESGKKLDEDVFFDGALVSGSDVYYLKDRSERTQSGTLTRLSGSKTTKIEDDVYAFALTRGGNIAYLANYSPDNLRGELAVWRKGKRTLVAEAVSAIL